MAAKEIRVRKYVVKLSEAERSHLQGLINKGKSPARRLLKARTSRPMPLSTARAWCERISMAIVGPWVSWVIWRLASIAVAGGSHRNCTPDLSISLSSGRYGAAWRKRLPRSTSPASLKGRLTCCPLDKRSGWPLREPWRCARMCS